MGISNAGQQLPPSGGRSVGTGFVPNGQPAAPQQSLGQIAAGLGGPSSGLAPPPTATAAGGPAAPAATMPSPHPLGGQQQSPQGPMVGAGAVRPQMPQRGLGEILAGYGGGRDFR